MGANALELSKVPFPIPEVPQTLLLGAVVGQGVENVSPPRLGERPNDGCGLRSPGEEYDDAGVLYEPEGCW